MEALLAGKCGRRGLQTCRSWTLGMICGRSCLFSSLIDLAADLICTVLAAGKYSRERQTVLQPGWRLQLICYSILSNSYFCWSIYLSFLGDRSISGRNTCCAPGHLQSGLIVRTSCSMLPMSCSSQCARSDADPLF